MSPLFTSWRAGTSIATGGGTSSRSINSRSISSSTRRSRDSELTLQNEKTTTAFEFKCRTDRSAQTMLTSVDERFGASVHQPCDTQCWTLYINDGGAHSKFSTLTPEVYGSQTAVFQQLTSRGRAPLVNASCVESRGPQTCSVAPVTCRLGTLTLAISCPQTRSPFRRAIQIACDPSFKWRSSLLSTARFQLRTNQEVEV